MRGDYRVQFVLRIVMIALVGVAVPVAATVGTATYTDMTQRADRTPVLHSVEATLDTDATPPPMGPGPTTAQAHWTVDGRQHSASVPVPDLARKGQQVPVAVTADGNPAPAPVDRSHALPDAVAAALMVLAGAVVVVVLMWQGVGMVFERRRRERWAREWAALANVPKWNRL
jgi:hypothetical protein